MRQQRNTFAVCIAVVLSFLVSNAYATGWIPGNPSNPMPTVDMGPVMDKIAEEVDRINNPSKYKPPNINDKPTCEEGDECCCTKYRYGQEKEIERRKVPANRSAINFAWNIGVGNPSGFLGKKAAAKLTGKMADGAGKWAAGKGIQKGVGKAVDATSRAIGNQINGPGPMNTNDGVQMVQCYDIKYATDVYPICSDASQMTGNPWANATLGQGDNCISHDGVYEEWKYDICIGEENGKQYGSGRRHRNTADGIKPSHPDKRDEEPTWNPEPGCSLSSTTAFFDGPKVANIVDFMKSLFGSTVESIPPIIPEVEAAQTIRYADLTDQQKQRLADQGWSETDLSNNPALQGLVDALNTESSSTRRIDRRYDTGLGPMGHVPQLYMVPDFKHNENALCPDDPNKEIADVCGCGVTETDTNNNDLTDCVELLFIYNTYQELELLDNEDFELAMQRVPQPERDAFYQAVAEEKQILEQWRAELEDDVQFPSWAPGGFLPDPDIVNEVAAQISEMMYILQENSDQIDEGGKQRIRGYIAQAEQMLLNYVNYKPEIVQNPGGTGTAPHTNPEPLAGEDTSTEPSTDTGFFSGVWTSISSLLGLGDDDDTTSSTFVGTEELTIPDDGTLGTPAGPTIPDTVIQTDDGFAPVMHDCPEFVLNQKYTLCNTATTNADLPFVFAPSCDHTGGPIACYYECVNKDVEVECEVCMDLNATNAGAGGECEYEEVPFPEPPVDPQPTDTISPEFTSQKVLGVQVEGLRLKRGSSLGLPAISNAVPESPDQQSLPAGEITFELYVTDTQELEDGQIMPGSLNSLASTITLERFVDGEATEFTCQDQTATAIPVTIASLMSGPAPKDKLGNMEFQGSFGDCLTKAGDYGLTIQIQDNSGNYTTKTFKNVIIPDVIDPIASDIISLCDQDDSTPEIEYPLANRVDSCAIEMIVVDQYGNPITDFSPSSMSFEAANGVIDANQGLSFIDGLQMSPGVRPQFHLRAGAPSIAQYGEHLGCLQEFPVNIIIEFPILDVAGNSTDDVVVLEREVGLRFDPIYTAQPQVDDDVILPGAFNVEIEHAFADAGNILPQSMLYSSADPGTTNFLDENLNEPGVSINQFTETMSTRLQEVPDGVFPLHFITRTEYQGTDGRTVAYPSGYLGPIPKTVPTLGLGDEEMCENVVGVIEPIPVTLIGATIEGNNLGENNNTLEFDDLGAETLFVTNPLSEDLGGNEMRSEIREGIWDYMRNEPELCPDGVFQVQNTADFQGLWGDYNDVVLFEDCEVQIGGESGLGLLPKIRPPQGQATLIIRNGNLKIDANMVYSNIEDSLGIVLINDDIVPYPANGNVVIHPKVKEFVGTYFIDGGMFGYNGSSEDVSNGSKLNTSIITNQELKNDLNNRQLILTGNLVSNNTLGGYMVGANQLFANSYFFTAWIKDEHLETAQLYDIHYIRRFDEPGNQDLCTRMSSGACDENRMAFVIRNDRRALNFPPPGF